MPATQDLNALIGSRICHDLISPLGAIGNGVELLSMTARAETPEMQLISDSVASANARVRLFRIAFGAAGDGARVRLSELQGILSDLGRGSRITTDLDAPPDLARGEAKLLLLLIQCAEAAMPRGGRIAATAAPSRIEVVAEGPALDPRPAWFGHLDARCGQPGDLDAAHVQFALAPLAARGIARRLSVDGTHALRLTARAP